MKYYRVYTTSAAEGTRWLTESGEWSADEKQARHFDDLQEVRTAAEEAEAKGCGRIEVDYVRNCQGCGEKSRAVRMRLDYYGLPTGHWCDDCYDDPDKYPYRKDAYFDPLYAGERLDDDY